MHGKSVSPINWVELIFSKFGIKFLHQALCCYHSLESSQRDNPNEWSKNGVWLRNLRLSIGNTPITLRSISNVGLRMLETLM